MWGKKKKRKNLQCEMFVNIVLDYYLSTRIRTRTIYCVRKSHGKLWNNFYIRRRSGDLFQNIFPIFRGRGRGRTAKFRSLAVASGRTISRNSIKFERVQLRKYNVRPGTINIITTRCGVPTVLVNWPGGRARLRPFRHVYINRYPGCCRVRRYSLT